MELLLALVKDVPASRVRGNNIAVFFAPRRVRNFRNDCLNRLAMTIVAVVNGNRVEDEAEVANVCQHADRA